MIETERLRLIPCTVEHFEAMLSDEQKLAALLGVTLANDWLGFEAAREAMPPSYEFLKSHPSAYGWWTYLFIHTADNKLIGLGGFKGVPDDSGMVELGYSIAPAYREQGLATEASRGMLDYAFSHREIRMVDAHTLPQQNASTRVLKKIGMQYVDTVIDPTDGEIWHWRLLREDYEKERS